MKFPTLQACGVLAMLAGSNALAAEAEAGDAAALATLEAVNAHEIEAAKLALDKGVGPAVAEYARMMQREHGENQRQTDQVAGKSGVDPVVTPGVEALEAKSRDTRAALARLDGERFEAAYIEAMVKDHAEVLAKLEKELIPGARDGAVADHLRQTRDHVAHHLEQAKSLVPGSAGSR